MSTRPIQFVGDRVVLTTDLTKYHPNLVVGAAGTTIGYYGQWSRGADRFVGVDFDDAGKFDVLWKSLALGVEEVA